MLAGSAVAQAAPKEAETTGAHSNTPHVLNVRLLSADRLPPLTRIELIREASSLWRDAHVRLNWINDDSAPDSDGTLQVLIARTTVGSSSGDSHRWVVGQLLKYEDERSMAVVSLAATERVLSESRRTPFMETTSEHDRRLGIAVGRAVAHEIGHYLLQTSTHAASGLMRAAFPPDQLADATSRAFTLDDEAQAHLNEAAAAGTTNWIGQARNGTFSYNGSPGGYATLEVVRPSAPMRAQVEGR